MRRTSCRSNSTVIRLIFQKRPMIAALKQAIAHCSSDPDWARVRPPLVELTAQEVTSLTEDFKKHGFSMPGLPELST
jgi:4-hydroxy-tetrahydrodipicolinate synthase